MQSLIVGAEEPNGESRRFKVKEVQSKYVCIFKVKRAELAAERQKITQLLYRKLKFFTL